MNLDLICMKFWMHLRDPHPASPGWIFQVLDCQKSRVSHKNYPWFWHHPSRLLFLVSGPSIAALHQAFSLKFLKPAAWSTWKNSLKMSMVETCFFLKFMSLKLKPKQKSCYRSIDIYENIVIYNIVYRWRNVLTVPHVVCLLYHFSWTWPRINPHPNEPITSQTP